MKRQKDAGKHGRHNPKLLLQLICLLLAAPKTWAAPVTRPSNEALPASRPSFVSGSEVDASTSNLTSLSLEDLMSVPVTTVTKTPERIADAPAAVTVISQEDIQRSGLDEIPEILRLSPGLFVQRGDQITGWSVAARGFGDVFDNKLLVLDDGISIYTPHFGGVYWNLVDYPIPDLDRIEVIRGPGATLWGSNAVDGVINIISKPADQTQGLMVDSRLGSDTSDLAVRYGGQLGSNTYFRVFAKGRDFGNDDVPGGWSAADRFDSSMGGLRLDNYATDKDTVTFQSGMSYENITDTQSFGQPIPGYVHDYQSEGNALARWTHVDSDTSDFALQAYYDRTEHRDSFVGDIMDTGDIDFHDRFQLWQGNELMWGTGARLQKDDVSSFFLPVPIVQPPSKEYYLFNVFVQDTLTIVPDKLNLFIGSKFEYDYFTRFNYQPSIRLLWTPTAKTSVWGAVSRAVRVPDRQTEDYDLILPVSSGPPETVLNSIGGGPGLQNEEEISYEIGLRHSFTKTFSADITAFANEYRDLIALVNEQPYFLDGVLVIPSMNVNAQSAQTYGTELALNWQVNPQWRLSGSYSLLEQYVQGLPTVSLNPGTYFPNTYPKNQFQIHSYMDLMKNLQFNSSLYYVDAIGPGAIVTPNQFYGVGSYARLDLSLVWMPRPDLRVALGVQNALDPQHQETNSGEGSNAVVNRAVYAQVTWSY